MSVRDTHCENCGQFHEKSVFEDQILKECPKCNENSEYRFETDEMYWAI